MYKSRRLKYELSDQGRLQINVSASDAAIPISGATIRITGSESDAVIDEIITDSSGQTPLIDLGTPPLEFSLEPGQPKPYSEYDLFIIAKEYEPISIKGVQLLPNCTALQNVNVNPNQPEKAAVQTIDIAPHTLWGSYPPKIPEAEVKPLPDSTGFVVLPDPVIPEYVIVHEGAPSDTSAKNRWIPFKDYIKNVASSEIYSTWPDATIRANVLAILSFTLNRIYTEWYRGKGQNFTITNSTAYDQAFVYGRNIFEEISIIVDEMFTNFITKPGIRQPLFTQYCDGSKIRCPNMLEQWGSQKLGEQGYDTMSILRRYYGQEIYLMQAQKVAGVPVSFPGTPLQMGSSGSSVRTIQEQLNSISNRYSLIKKIKVDGYYGEDTRAAVEAFQQIFHLPISGVVDFSTWYQISNIYVAIENLAELV